jgi:spore maturation protein CgeB
MSRLNFKILFVGCISNKLLYSYKHWCILRELFAASEVVDISFEQQLHQRRLMRRLDGRAFYGDRKSGAQRRILDAVEHFKPDIVWFEKPLIVDKMTIGKIRLVSPESYLICLQDDNPFGARHYERPFWNDFIQCVSLYDFHFVKRQSDMLTFRKYGARNLAFFWSGYDSKCHFETANRTCAREYDFSFIGTNIDDRSQFLTALVGRLRPRSFRVAGARWNRSMLRYRYPGSFSSVVSDLDFRKITCDSVGCLGLFSTSNGDDFSGRLFQIAACGGTIVAPRSAMHEFFFRDGSECLLFDNLDHCVSLLRRLLSNPSYAHAIGSNARARAIASGYSLEHRLNEACDTVIDAMAKRG